MKFVFVHGGPGLNSNPEKNLLQDKFESLGHSIAFWNEPSILRSEGVTFSAESAYPNWLNSLENFINTESRDQNVTIIAHSFAAYAINDLLPKISSQLEKLILLAPIFDLLTLDKNILNIAVDNFNKKNLLEESKEIENLMKNMNETFNESRFMSLVKAIGNDEVLPAYWYNKTAAGAYNQYFAEEKFQIDFQSFKAVRSTISKNKAENKFLGDVTIIYGEHDPVASLAQDMVNAKNLYPNANISINHSSGHYPHVEDSEFFNLYISHSEVLSELTV